MTGPEPGGLDLHDPATANAVAEAIVRYRGGGFVSLSERYPWQFPRDTAPARTRAADAVDRARRYSDRAVTLAYVSIGLAAFALGFTLRGLLDGILR